jgi:hypothetical protein
LGSITTAAPTEAGGTVEVVEVELVAGKATVVVVVVVGIVAPRGGGGDGTLAGWKKMVRTGAA